ncbi:hypothetical protein [Cetobacterium sp. SF1]|uniref:hypothetical protein n=1 Tax=Cetobacterium sp. SF1 TaxID=3417654 RepID=UPI003CFA775C
MGLLDKYKKSKAIFEKKIDNENKKFDYSDFTTEEKLLLIELEQKAAYTGKLLRENLKDLALVFKEAQEIFVNNKNCNFSTWYTNLGFKKDFVYLCLERYNLALKFRDNSIYNFPDRAIRDLKKLNEMDEEDFIIEILDDEPIERLKEYRNITFLSKMSIEDEKKQILLLRNMLKDKRTQESNDS